MGHPSPKDALGDALGRYKRMLAHVHWGLERNGITLDPDLRIYFRIASTREEARNTLYWKHALEVLEVLRGAQIDCVFIRGAGAALGAYPSAVLRHSHDVDLLVSPGRAADTVAALADRGFTESQIVAPTNRLLPMLVHPSQLEFVVHESVFSGVGGEQTLRSLMDAIIEVSALEGGEGGAMLPVLDQEETLLQALADLYQPPNRKSLFTFCDLWHLVHKLDDMDIERVTRGVRERKLAIGCGMTLALLESLESDGADLARSVLGPLSDEIDYAEFVHFYWALPWRRRDVLALLARREGVGPILREHLRRKFRGTLGIRP